MLLFPWKTPQCKQTVNMYGIPVPYFVHCNMGLFTSLCRGVTIKMCEEQLKNALI